MQGNYLLTQRKGIKCTGNCDFCKKQLTDDLKCTIYACKHSFHKLCHDDMYKCLTCYHESENSILQNNIFGSQIRVNTINDTSEQWSKS